MITEAIERDPTTSAVAKPLRVEEGYSYGWREVRKITEDGRSIVHRIPLTLTDVLHPREDDFLMTSDEHARFCNYLYNTLRWAIREQPDAHILYDTNVDWGLHTEGCPRPDITLIVGVREHKNWSTFVVAAEGTAPTMIIEVTSPATRTIDLDAKVDEYEQAGVPYYIIVDKHVRKRRTDRQLLGWELTADGYVAMQTDGPNRLWLEPVKLWLCIEGDQLVCYDEQGEPIVDYVVIAALRAAAEERAIREAARAQEEAARATEEKARADAAEARIRALEEELRRRQ